MIRAFAVGLAVGTIRIWIGLFEAFGVLETQDAFGVAFWISFLLHAAVAELWLFWRPGQTGAVRSAEPRGLLTTSAASGGREKRPPDDRRPLIERSVRERSTR